MLLRYVAGDLNPHGPHPSPAVRGYKQLGAKGKRQKLQARLLQRPRSFQGQVAGLRQVPRATGRTYPLNRKGDLRGSGQGTENMLQGFKGQRVSKNLSGDAEAEVLEGSRRFKSIRYQNQSMIWQSF